jgi:enhancing lycopene biosynthesis protein 2
MASGKFAYGRRLTMPARVGVVLSGCGVFDGSEIHEAVSILIALDRRAAQAVCLAPNIPQSATVNHLNKKPDPHTRNVLEESARIARGKVRDLATARAADLDALAFPGGFGAAKNLSTFAAQGARCEVNPEVERLVREMVAAGKPIGLACIAPVLAARILGGMGLNPRLTIGSDPATADAIRSMNASHVNTEPADVCVDEANRIVTTPCYMNDVGPWVVYQGAEKMVDQLLRMAGAS